MDHRLTSEAIRELVEQGALQLSLLDEQNLAEITALDYPGERLVVCHNPVLEEERAGKRQALTGSDREEFGEDRQGSGATQKEVYSRRRRLG